MLDRLLLSNQVIVLCNRLFLGNINAVIIFVELLWLKPEISVGNIFIKIIVNIQWDSICMGIVMPDWTL